MIRLVKFLLLSGLTLLIVGSAWAQPSDTASITRYTDFLRKQRTSAKDYVLSLFKEHDIVILCERLHSEFTQYELIGDILQDRYFTDSVGVLFTEIGPASLNPQMNLVLQNPDLTKAELDEKLLYFQRNASFWPIWENYNFTYLMQRVHGINRKLPPAQKIAWYPSDMPFSWENMTAKSYAAFRNTLGGRDSIIAKQIIEQFDRLKQTNPQQKALVIMNYRHAFGQAFRDSKNRKPDNVGRYLFDRYPGEIANVLINSFTTISSQSDNNQVSGLHQQGKWEAAFQVMKKEDAGFDFKDSPFGSDAFDYWLFKNNYTYQDVFNGLVFYHPVTKFEMVSGVPHLMENGFIDECIRRYAVFSEVFKQPAENQDSLRKNLMKYNERRLQTVKDFPATQIDPSMKSFQQGIDRWIQ